MMADHSGHLLLFLVPLVFVALFRFRRLLPVAAMLLLLHHHLDPLPGSASPTPPPVCCTMAQSTEPTKTEVPTRHLMTFRAPSTGVASPPQGSPSAPPAIRAPPATIALPAPASWTPVSRAA
jgi:hypothetical protein